ncbi:hypothetical protein G647_02484 [Cladophialophora carrionii CBS 160.54]|uniref:DUF3752 domain-containing protein n=1 Tax=Cladophialophora carrionii CBS 160.54 TaxID=1279043 RepID=V9DFR9_9EURO|nr:uncharacterized protein G647_02484 [Cladophialophora carrionii CBS 160.54]ETI25710.1 hypothetical protein G647_02484 [Cladophialophora carrionii CBS 160.54]
MPAVGPQLPPDLQKRRRDDDHDDEGHSSDSSTGPSPPPRDEEQTAASTTKRARVIGPAPPPAPLDERPVSGGTRLASEAESESEDDDFGPSLPSATETVAQSSNQFSIGPQMPVTTASAAPAKRDEWMTIAPSNGDWSSRVDPTKLKNRKFNTGRGAKAPSRASDSGADSSWHETPEQKQARLKREVMGIQDTATSAASSKSASGNNSHDDTTAKRMKEYTEAQRGPSLYASHTSSQDKPLDDDPSARAFDREKDIGSGSTISATKRREMVKKATDFSSRFEKARYL